MKRPWLLPLVPVYGAGLWMKQRLAAEPKRLQWPVVSIGSLSAGGAGKTPIVLALAKLLEQDGYTADVLSRGYGRSSNAIAAVDPGGTAEVFGDEPLLLAKTGLRVWVGANRFEAGTIAEACREHPYVEVERRVHLLDDGFQHRQLARALDLVVLTAADLEDCLLPAGNLREPLRQLRRAGAIVLREEEAERLRPLVRQLAGEVPLWIVRRHIVVSRRSIKPLAFCGIAHPEVFFTMLQAADVQLAGQVSFRDHHPYQQADIKRLLAKATRGGADGFVTTEKDAVKLDASMREQLEASGPVEAVQLITTWIDEEAVLQTVAETLRRALLLGVSRQPG